MWGLARLHGEELVSDQIGEVNEAVHKSGVLDYILQGVTTYKV